MTPQQADALSGMGAAILSNGQPYRPYTPSYNPLGPGILVGQSFSGMTKTCVYSRSGSPWSVTIPITDICASSIP